jgi:hypothetical protein
MRNLLLSVALVAGDPAQRSRARTKHSYGHRHLQGRHGVYRCEKVGRLSGSSHGVKPRQQPAQRSLYGRDQPPSTPSSGGGAGKVWVNTASKVYHCPGDRWYGKTRHGSYMSEAQAQAQGARPDHGRACSS